MRHSSSQSNTQNILQLIHKIDEDYKVAVKLVITKSLQIITRSLAYQHKLKHKGLDAITA